MWKKIKTIIYLLQKGYVCVVGEGEGGVGVDM